jgi:predicted kinase
MAGVPLAMGAAAPFEEGLYQPETTARVYEELLAQAGPLLSQGETVVLDASWTHAPWRREARRLARLRGACIVELRCEVPDEVARARMAARHGAGGDPSDATPDVADRMHAAADPWPEAIAMDTRAAAAEVVAAARTVIRKR